MIDNYWSDFRPKPAFAKTTLLYLWQAKRGLLSRSFRLDRQSMYRVGQLSLEEGIDSAMTIHAAFAFESFGNHFNLKVRSAFAMCRSGTHNSMGMTRMLMRFIDHFQHARSKPGFKLAFNPLGHTRFGVFTHLMASSSSP
jgi:myosin-crossreactive antigen